MLWKKYADYITSIFFIILSIAIILIARKFPKSAIMEIGPDFMPIVIGFITLILAVILLIKTILQRKKTEVSIDESKVEEYDYKRMLISLILILVYVFVLKPIGFIISTLVYLLPQMYILAPNNERNTKSIITLAIVDIVFTMVVFFLFRYGFKIVLPAGIFTINL